MTTCMYFKNYFNKIIYLLNFYTYYNKNNDQSFFFETMPLSKTTSIINPKKVLVLFSWTFL